MPTTDPAPAASVLQQFVRDQVEAVKIARLEAAGEGHQRRLDACYLAMRFLDDLNGGAHGSHTVGSVVSIARQFEAFLAEP